MGRRWGLGRRNDLEAALNLARAGRAKNRWVAGRHPPARRWWQRSDRQSERPAGAGGRRAMSSLTEAKRLAGSLARQRETMVRYGSAKLDGVGLGGEMLHQNLADAFAFERNMAGEHFVEDDAQGVDVDFFAVAPLGDFGGHVVDGADAAGLAAAAASRR